MKLPWTGDELICGPGAGAKGKHVFTSKGCKFKKMYILNGVSENF
jgi:hypothetical protein